MRMWWGLGPVFAYESLLSARRWQVYAGRSIFVLALLVGMTIVWISQVRLVSTFLVGQLPSYRQMAKVGEWLFYTMAGVQVSLVMLAAPAAAAGSICMDRAARDARAHADDGPLGRRNRTGKACRAADTDYRDHCVRRAGCRPFG